MLVLLSFDRGGRWLGATAKILRRSLESYSTDKLHATKCLETEEAHRRADLLEVGRTLGLGRRDLTLS
jgi:hypothetical protein